MCGNQEYTDEHKSNIMKKFIITMLSEGPDASSKRTNGTMCILVTLLLVCGVVIFKMDILPIHEALISMVFWGGITLLGITGAEKFLKK